MDYKAGRASLIEHLSHEIRDQRVLTAMSHTPRELFVPPESLRYAYEDKPLSIGWGQTISQPLIIALMTEALELTGCEKVLEVGTGSGYQAAILAELCTQVITVERLPTLAEKAKLVLGGLGHYNVEIHIAGKTLGWASGAPYQAIIVTAGAPDIPAELLSQLDIGGRMVIPVGSRYVQDLCKITKHRDKTSLQKLGACRFVSLIGRHAWER